MRGSIYVDSDELRDINVRLTSGTYYPLETFMEFDLKHSNFTMYLAPEDLPRIAGTLRRAAENIEALIGASDEKAKPILHLVPKPSASDALTRAA